MPEKQPKQIKESSDDWTRGIPSDEIIKTTNMNIHDDYGKTIILKDDHLTARKVFITQLPERKPIKDKKTGKEKMLLYMQVKEPASQIEYSMSAESIATRRSLQAIKIKMAQAIAGKELTPNELEAITNEKFMEMLEGKLVGIKRRPFDTEYGQVDPLQFYMLDDE